MRNANGLLARIVRDKQLWRFGCRRRSFCSLKVTSDDLDNQVLFEGSGCSRTAILNRPPALNALTTHMGVRLHKLYKNWEEDPNIGFVMMKGSGRAFCAGGDIVSIYHLRKRGSPDAIREFFWTLYNFIYFLGTYLKPHVAILNGVTMGGGAGVSIPGTFRVATDRTIFATPETVIGFHPDAGASFNLSHLPGRLGEYLGLTGLKISGAEMLACGLATHYISSTEVPVLEEQLKKLLTDDPSVVEATLEKCAEAAHPEKTGVIRRIELLEKCFCHDTVEEIIDSLEVEAGRTKDIWCATTLRRLKETSPLSLKVALRSVREGRFQTLDQCLIREYRMSLQGTVGNFSGNFCEGVRARLIDKDDAPKWDPPTLEKVTEDMVDNYFSPLTPSEPDLDLPIKLRESI
ncbi:3-hydroxyisobutyryl-CoA hydrolase-like protein 1 [Raphanus sativus]|uniref:3-hydroxyisobutyryl-CoA hydrolase n=1 Tax=Raphanus sativus TaxID=3726 RepID=A0A6J0KHI7_RAPSA|nr:3-hydroxyisobutyryl-CoA hydrolase-like protein 1, mitochondrial [Raphanus sativus]XP_056846838.1 3-hydroxyisobutyryl-CoA hydrolase-like protein 1, mitochondrial [Raphanus sativus]KAJ4884948.1 3-hydroxyisobutyryl-CoA hydrolase-like protein 1 [Raphanus sativus]